MFSLSRFRLLSHGRSFCTTLSRSAEIEVSNSSEHVVHVRLNRPERRNAYTVGLWQETKEVFDRLSDDPKCRAIVLSGNGKSFCSGIDLVQGMGTLIQKLQDDSIDVARKGRLFDKFARDAQASFTSIEKCRKPVIAAVHSHCVGAGIDLLVSCDIRYAAQDSVFNVKEVDIGMAADVGTLNRMPKVVGNDSWMRELAYTARDFGPDEALKFGLISRIFPSKEECIAGALALAETIATKSPIGVQGTKEALVYARDHTVEDSLRMIRHWNMSQLQSTDLMESAMAAMQKKKPTYADV